MTRGQFIRLFLGEAAASTQVLAAAKELTLHVSSTVEDASTKDTTGSWLEQEVTATSFDIQTNALILAEDDELATGANMLADFEGWMDAEDQTLYFSINNVSSTNNRTKGTAICSGQCKLTSLQINAQNKQNASYSATLNGYGALTI